MDKIKNTHLKLLQLMTESFIFPGSGLTNVVWGERGTQRMMETYQVIGLAASVDVDCCFRVQSV